MSDPQIVDTYGNVLIYYVCDRDPTPSEPLVYNNYEYLLLFWWNTSTNSMFWSANTTADSMIWIEEASNANILSILDTLGWEINTNRDYSSQTLAVNTGRTPSATNDTNVTITFSHTSTLLTAATVTVDVNTSGSWVTIAQSGLSGLAATSTAVVTVLVPKNAQYRWTSSSGTNSVTSIYEISM
jgi:hypothetical protein